jgi:SagB-type dehydrogenase family enzyme
MTNDTLPDVEYRLHPFFRIRFGAAILCDLPLEGVTIELPDARYVSLIESFDRPRRPAFLAAVATAALGVELDEAQRIIRHLAHSGLLVRAAQPQPLLPAIRHWIDRGWLDGLFLHLRSRNLPFDDDRSSDPERFCDDVLADVLAREGAPEIWKSFPDRPSVALPLPNALPTDRTLEQVLLARRSNRPWTRGQVTAAELSTILHHANIEGRRLRVEAERDLDRRPGTLLNSSFSAIETYLFAFDVEFVVPGIYHYGMKDHQLSCVREGLLREQLAKMCIGQERAGGAACALVMTAIWDRYMYRYRHARAYRTLLINLAELAQKYIVLATTFGFSTFLTPALEDTYADELLNVDGYREAPLYVVAFG